ncbi:MAG: permease-like cell division protein FtsX [Zoogloeaceae bacterium]|jgi:cell division transport system permease protein|nr:permease-like cell division protein FtsX [Zoogloeaceae bacterium]
MKGWLLHHRQAAAQALRRLAATPLNTLLGALVLGTALALPAGGEMMLANFQRLARHIAATPQLSVFMALDTSVKEVDEIESMLRKHPQTLKVRKVPREETLRRLKESEGLGEVIESLPRNPFPDAFVVAPKDESHASLEAMRAEFVNYPHVEHVQLDSAWVKKLDAFLRLARLAVAFLAAVLGIALVAVTFNTIRLQILTQEAEIEVSRLLGATDAFIRRPFFYFGALQGLAGGLVAWFAVFAATLLLRGPVADLAALYGVEFALHILPLADSVLLLGLAALLGLAGAWAALFRYLRD